MKMKNISILPIVLLFVLSCNKKSENLLVEPIENLVENIVSKQCFFKAENKDTTNVSLTIKGNVVTGEMVWNPYEKDGAKGILTGTIEKNGELVLLYDYMIEGNKQTETKIMKIENGNLMIKKGELIDPNNDGNLKYKNADTAIFSEKLTSTNCK